MKLNEISQMLLVVFIVNLTIFQPRKYCVNAFCYNTYDTIHDWPPFKEHKLLFLRENAVVTVEIITFTEEDPLIKGHLFM